MGKIISVNNFKGGVSKTTTVCLLAYILSEKKNKKVLVVDFDPQADASELMLTTFQKTNEGVKTIFEGIKNHDRAGSTIKLSENLDVITSDFDLTGFTNYLIRKYNYKETYDKVKELSNFLEGAREEYDIVIIDTPPTISEFSNNAIYACDYTLLVMQTHKRSYRAIGKFIGHLLDFKDIFNNNFDVLGIVPVMFSKQTKTDMSTLQDATEEYKEHVFNHVVKHMERVKYWDQYGITELDHWDKKTIAEYEALADEFLERLEKAEAK